MVPARQNAEFGTKRLPPTTDELPPLFQLPPIGSVAYSWLLTGYISIPFGLAFYFVVLGTYPIISNFIRSGSWYFQSALLFLGVCTQLLLFYAHYSGRYCAPTAVGRPLKLAMDLIALLLALPIPLLNSWNADMVFLLFLLVSYTIYVHSVVQLRFRPRDTGFLDLVLHLSIESLVCLSGSGGVPCVCLAVLLLCAAIILCRCLFYSASKGGCHFEKDKDDDLRLVNSEWGTAYAGYFQDGSDKSKTGSRHLYHLV
ncbi:hypothetical protein COLO4_17599 [Corchorus olitorius]|uniref:Uncharacterized protein n=1 Tax=Corchorus olitorius TaxID=93759 RepID=A0A1R3JC56_9ROSI|nr:hypothetical protein COLO4_17599 [Corchorus olitorius]